LLPARPPEEEREELAVHIMAREDGFQRRQRSHLQAREAVQESVVLRKTHLLPEILEDLLEVEDRHEKLLRQYQGWLRDFLRR